ncbi:GNAT family N-acetyltransferase [Evansella halocellulosilytica]|uniref:GNAT family N-acetyltransferase n=1 Tax=Evansella halocellulosilytica TaxID=2011013 RepID=UPI000BB6AD04|nr:GNAT family N-acetyltransferase [Evansella halocellulosilytica]
MTWKIKFFDELTTTELYNILKERVQIFIVEQQCPYPEIDDNDQVAYHIFNEKDGEVAAYARVLPKGTTYDEAAIGRVIVKKEYRGHGLGNELMEQAMNLLTNRLDETEIKLSAQDYIKHYYAAFGFKQVSDVYLEDDIPHVDMLYKKE